MMKRVTVYTDGSCKGNPGPGGYGVVLRYTAEDGQTYEKELSAGYRLTTNNRMEILAAVIALEALKVPCEVDLYSDSQYLVNAMNEGWVDKWKRLGWYRDAKRREKAKNVDLWQRLETAAARHQVRYSWVKGHAENEFNNRCDELAQAAASDPDHLQEDPEYSSQET